VTSTGQLTTVCAIKGSAAFDRSARRRATPAGNAVRSVRVQQVLGVEGRGPRDRGYHRAVRNRPLWEAAGFWVWMVVAASIVDFGVFRLPLSGWQIVGAQVGGYALTVLPVVIWSPGTFLTLAMPPWQAAVGLVLVGVAVAYEILDQHVAVTDLGERALALLATAIGEEIAFRGFLWERLRASGIRVGWLIVVDVLAFTAWHLVSLAAGLSQPSDLIGVAVFGVIFCLARLWAGNTGVPALLHLATDIAGV
jgi:membrane protease YdiL (CAAX protease family)